MRYTSITSAGGLGVQIVDAKTRRSPKRQPPQPEHERDDDSPDEQVPPPPGMGKIVDKTA
jgi:hypothetical protein